MTRIAYIGCGKAKHEITGHPNQAENQYCCGALYTSNYFRMKREYAERMCDHWRVLTAKFGTLDPWCATTPYDVRLTRRGFEGDDEPRYPTVDEWAEHVLESIDDSARYHEKHAAHDPITEIVVLAGKAYVEPIREGLIELGDAHSFEIAFPFDGTSGLSEQVAWLRDNTDPAAPVGSTYASVMNRVFGEEFEHVTGAA